ncbi:MAG: DUF3618 domain-containing protein [Gemmatimonadota bacterium]
MTGSFDTPTSGNDRSFGGSDRNNDEVDETEVIAADIRSSQERLGDTVEEIGERFNPTRLKEELKSDIRDATIGKVENMAQQTADMVSDAQRSIMESIRENPIPFVLTGIGLGWIILNSTSRKKQMGSRTGSSSLYDDQQGDGYDYEMQNGNQYGNGSRRSYGGQFGSDQFDDKSGALDKARSKAGDVVDSVKHKTSEFAEQTQRTASRVGERAEDMAHDVADQARVQTRRLSDAFRENPLVIGAAALALGLAAGLAIPATGREAELMGETRDHMVDKVRDVAEDTKSKVQQVAERVIDQAETTAKDASHEVGLMSS